MIPNLEAVFGNRTAACTLLFLQNYGSGHANRISTTFGIGVRAVQLQLQRLEAGGILVSNMVGRTRVFEFSPRGTTVKHLRVFLEAELEDLPSDLIVKYLRERTRPRRTGKPLVRA